MGSIGSSASASGKVALESLLPTDSLRGRARSLVGAPWSAPFSDANWAFSFDGEAWALPTFLRLREGVAIESGVSASEFWSASRRERRPVRLVAEGGMVGGQRLGKGNGGVRPR